MAAFSNTTIGPPRSTRRSNRFFSNGRALGPRIHGAFVPAIGVIAVIAPPYDGAVARLFQALRAADLHAASQAALYDVIARAERPPFGGAIEPLRATTDALWSTEFIDQSGWHEVPALLRGARGWRSSGHGGRRARFFGAA